MTRQAPRHGALAVGLGMSLLLMSGCQEHSPHTSTAQPANAGQLPPLPEFSAEPLEPVVRQQLAEALAAAKAAPEDAGATGRLAMLLQAYELSDAALACYQRAAALEPDNARWWYGIGRMGMARGDSEAAADSLDRALESAPGNVAALFQRAEIDRVAGRNAEARAPYERVLAADPSHAQARHGLAQVMLKLGFREQAIDQLREAIRLADGAGIGYGVAHYSLAMALRESNPHQAAAEMQLAEAQRGREPPINDPWEREIDSLVSGGVDSLHRGIAMLRDGKVDDAIPLLEAAVRLQPDLAEAHSQLGSAYLSRGEVDRGEVLLQKAIALDPDHVPAIYNLGYLAHQGGDYEQSTKLFEQVLRIRSEHFDAELGLGMDLPQVGRAAEAADHLRSAIRLNPSDDRAYKRLANLLAEMGDFAGAVDVLRDGLASRPADLAIQERLAWMLATAADDDIRNGEEALRIAQQVCAKSDHPRPLDTLAAALANLGRFEEAVAAGERALAGARAKSDAALAEEIAQRISLYKAGSAFRQAGAATQPHSR